MTYPQNTSAQAVLIGQDFWRLNTPLATPGDVYESEVGCLALALGPNSDLGSVLITYLDPTAPPAMLSQAILSPDRAFIGRIDATDVAYPLSNRRGRILISANDIYDPGYRPLDFTAGDQFTIETPVIDVIQYFSSVPSLTPARSDKVFRYQYFPAPTGGGVASWVMIPSYGRKSAFFTFLNRSGLATTSVEVRGIKFSTSGSPGPDGSFNKTLMANADLLSGETATFVFDSQDGVWDCFLVRVGRTGNAYGGAALATTISMSDDAI